MEKFSSLDRVVGSISESGKEEILVNQKERFNNQFFEDLEGKEKEKTLEDLQIINLVNNATNELRRKYGLEDFDVSANNIHIINNDNWTLDKGALFSSNLQAIAIKDQPVRLWFMISIFHEMIHFKSYSSLQITDNDNPEIANYRLGLMVYTRDGKKNYFTNLNEAITEEMTKRFSVKLLNNPLFAEEINRTKEVINKYSGAVNDSGKLIFGSDTFFAEVNNKVSDSIEGKENTINISSHNHPQKKERKILNILIDKIYKKNEEIFKNRDEVFEIFAKGMMTGDIVPVVRIVDGTFGHGVLRQIGDLDKNIKEQKKFISLL